MPPRAHIARDMNGGLGIMLKRGLEALGIEAELPRQIKVKSFLATPSRVKPITHNPAKRRGNTVARARAHQTQLSILGLRISLLPHFLAALLFR